MKEIVLDCPSVLPLAEHAPAASHHGLLQGDKKMVLRCPVYNNKRYCFSEARVLYSDYMGIHESYSEREAIKKALESGGRVFAFNSFEDALRWALEK